MALSYILDSEAKPTQACNCLFFKLSLLYKAMAHRPISLYRETHKHVEWDT